MKNVLVGRKKEKEELFNLYHSRCAEFVTVYGRRRVGKTFLINSLFENEYTFKVTAILGGSKQEQLKIFTEALSKYGKEDKASLPD